MCHPNTAPVAFRSHCFGSPLGGEVSQGLAQSRESLVLGSSGHRCGSSVASGLALSRAASAPRGGQSRVLARGARRERLGCSVLSRLGRETACPSGPAAAQGGPRMPGGGPAFCPGRTNHLLTKASVPPPYNLCMLPDSAGSLPLTKLSALTHSPMRTPSWPQAGGRLLTSSCRSYDTCVRPGLCVRPPSGTPGGEAPAERPRRAAAIGHNLRSRGASHTGSFLSVLRDIACLKDSRGSRGTSLAGVRGSGFCVLHAGGSIVEEPTARGQVA